MSFSKTAWTAGFYSLLLLLTGTGCQLQQSVSTVRLIQHQAAIDFSGLKDAALCDAVKVHVAAPQTWQALPVKKAALYTDMQWRSPSKQTGVGVCYVRMPLPFSAQTLMWLAKQEYSKKSQDAEVLGEWTDPLGRPWFEAQNSKYHIRGYVVTKGFEAWVVYCGYRRAQPPSAPELGVAARSLETIVPTPFAEDVPRQPVAKADEAQITASPQKQQ